MIREVTGAADFAQKADRASPGDFFLRDDVRIHAMDVETSKAIETLGGDIRSVERTVKGVASQVVEINAKLVTVDARLATVDAKLATVDAKLDELRVHTQGLNEAVRDDIQMVAEAVAALTAKSATRQNISPRAGDQDEAPTRPGLPAATHPRHSAHRE